jgi:CMP-N-acetylneuraminic acid synthetase
MARGWESKSVEAQQAEADDKRQGELREKMTPEQGTSFRERETLRLSRQQVLQQLQASSNPRHRKLLEEALASLDEKLKSLEK